MLPTDWHFFKPMEDIIFRLRMFTALAMSELGMDASARGFLGAINNYRETRGLVALRLEKSEIKRWDEKDPDLIVSFAAHGGPEV